MKTKELYTLLLLAFIIVLLGGCDTDQEAIVIQKPYKYSKQYYADLRAYKKSDHQIFYGWYAAYGQKEGVQASYKQSASWGEHIAGLPDSLDFCSLWMGIPTPEENPIAYNEMRRSMEVRGIKMVMPEIVRIEKYEMFSLSDTGIQDYADYLVDKIFEYDLDGLDLDYEPEGDWIGGENFGKMVEIIGESLGPMSANPDKYLIIDYYNQEPPSSVEPYINYLVNQAYTQGITENSASNLQGRYDQASWCPPEKFVVTENFGDWWATGGSPFTEVDGNTLTSDGKQMYSLEGMARWNPIQGRKAGFGAFYFDRDYYNIPAYCNVKRCIQIANPAVH